MPEYLAPGVFVEEVSYRAKSIEGVGTSVAGLVGPTRTGPIRGIPEVVTSYAEFERVYGSPGDLGFGDSSQINHTALAARAFFDNGGKQLFVSRVVNGGNSTDAEGNGSSATSAGASHGGVSFKARFPGSGGNLTLAIGWADTQNLLKTQNLGTLSEGQTALLHASGSIQSADVNNPGAYAGNYPLKSLTALVTLNAGNLVFAPNTKITVMDTDDSTSKEDAASIGESLVLASLSDDTLGFTRIHAASPASGALADGTAAELVLSGKVDISDYVAQQKHWGDIRIVRGTLNAAGDTFHVSRINSTIAGEDDEYDIHLSALAGVTGGAQSLTIQREFAIDAIRDNESIFSVSGISLGAEADDDKGLGKVLSATPEKRLEQLTQPISASVANGVDVFAALIAMCDDKALNPSVTSFSDPAYLITLSGGSDGDMPVAIDYAGEEDEVKGSTGLTALEQVEDIAIVMTPAASADAGNHVAIISELQKHCARMRYRVGIVDSREGMALSEVRALRDNFDDSRLALYYPWVVTSDPTAQRDTITVPPSGFMAGIYARTDVNRGVHKSPANVAVFGALRFNQQINRFQQELLNPNGINCLRSFPGRGHRVWGGRTLSSDPEWKYLNVRRYFLFLERSIEKGTQWAVFEPNGEALWANVRTTIEDFLFNEWKNGHLLGAEPKAAYFVRCDRSTMTQNDIDNGRLVCEIGVAPLRPAEFVIFRIGQKTADA